MKAFKNTILLIAVACLASGCYYTQPQRYGGQPSLGTTAVGAVSGAAGGAAVGNAINKDYGAPVGAAAGAVLGGGIAYTLAQRQQREVAEAYDAGERKGRAQVFDEWWSEIAITNDPMEKNKPGPKTRQVQLPEGDYESVPYHRRTYPYMIKP